jgi:hypothetical protein
VGTEEIDVVVEEVSTIEDAYDDGVDGFSYDDGVEDLSYDDGVEADPYEDGATGETLGDVYFGGFGEDAGAC